jgi:group I intron endonuclease
VKESHGCIYLLTNLINGKRYVGQHKNVLTVARRWKRHVTVAITTNDERPLYRAIRKAWKRDRRSLDGFRAEVIWSGAADVKRLNAKETYYVKKLHSFIDDPKGDRSYNLTKGGGQPVRSKQSKEKLTAAMAKRWARSTERAILLQAYENPVLHKKLSVAQTRRYEDSSERKAQSLRLRRHYAEPKNRKKQSVRSKSGWAKIPPEDRSAIRKRAWARKTPEERTAIANRIWKTRRANARKRKAK